MTQIEKPRQRAEPRTAPSQVRASVVIPTYNRSASLVRLLLQLEQQDVPRGSFEVIVADDGSPQPVAPLIERLALSIDVRVLSIPHAGPAASRHAAALLALGEILIFLDDDMQVPPCFIAEHIAAHPSGTHNVVLGRIRPDPALANMPVFERFHAFRLAQFAEAYGNGSWILRGNNVCTGNVSMRREDYFRTGGLDASLRRSEDAELGLRLERLGVSFSLLEAPYALHGSDHRSTDRWLDGAFQYGIDELRIGRKHPDMPHADPWRYFFALNNAARPFLLLGIAAPEAARKVGRATMQVAEGADRLGLERPALAMAGIAYGMTYYAGVRQEAGSFRAAAGTAVEFLAKSAADNDKVKAPRFTAACAKAVLDFKADMAVRQHYEDKYGYPGERSSSLPMQLANKVGLQIAAGYRLMRLFHNADMPLAAKVTSRLVRHVYGADIHWKADFSPGVMINHGMGLAVGPKAKVGTGCILSQNCGVGCTLEDGVHVQPGAILLGPITIGAGTKIGPGAVVLRSVPAHSIVEAPAPTVRPKGGPLPPEDAVS